ncbi:MAG TPA: hypothetical protein VK570_05380, partial [Rubrivivax sp.]|nr:hypothetical protein [Rubrivivax sp.]
VFHQFVQRHAAAARRRKERRRGFGDSAGGRRGLGGDDGGMQCGSKKTTAEGKDSPMLGSRPPGQGWISAPFRPQIRTLRAPLAAVL